jgi:hypothetical protein
MSHLRGRIVPVLLAATVLVGGANLAAYAANGAPLLLGKGNKATKVTKLKNTKGSALSLQSKAGTAPLSVSNSTKVGSLNADLVDGLDGAALQNKTYVYELVGTTATDRIAFPLPGLPAGRYLASYNVSGSAPGSASFACLFTSGATTASVPASGVALGSSWFVSGSGYLDTTALTYVLSCIISDSGITVPVNTTPPTKSQVVLTRIDDVTSTVTAGTAG